MATPDSAGVPSPAMEVRVEPAGQRFTVPPGQTLLMAALAAGVDLPYECASGSCGSCRAQLLEGQVEALWADAPGLSTRERLRGDRVLCCQSRPTSPCAIRVRLGADTSPPVRPRHWRSTVRRLRPLNHEVMHIELDAGEGVDFLPGQFMLFELPGRIGRRAYSMSNLANVDGSLEFIAKRKPGGAGTAHLFEALRSGDRIHLEGPYGRAWFRQDSARDAVLLAGGSGLAPIWSIAQAALRRKGPGRRIRLFFGVNRVEELFWRDELEQACRSDARLEVTWVLGQASAHDPAGARHGLVGQVMQADGGDLRNADLYMAGPPGLIDSVLRDCVATGKANADRVFFDRFC